MSARPATARPSLSVTLALDAVVVLVFAAIGRGSHDEANPVLGALDTAWPFLVGALVGHLLVRFVASRPSASLIGGVVVWITSVVIGMLLRQLTGDGTAVAFIVVATCFLGFFLVGWRALVALAGRSRV